MKTSSYDGSYDEELDAVADEYQSEVAAYEAQTESYGDQTGSYDPVAQSYESTFAKCKVAPIVESSEEEEIAESFESSFAKCFVISAPKEQTDDTCEDLPESHKTSIIENNEITSAKTDEAPIANVTPQHENLTQNIPPPVPKRTLLPTKTPKETTVAPETQQREIVSEESDTQNVAYRDIELVSPEDVTQKTETCAERWSDSTSVSLPGQVEDVETVSSDPGNAQCEPVSEMYYTASSEVSLLSDTEVAEKVQNEEDEQSKDDRKNVIAGHVAAMRERFESMTRTNTPCPDLARSLSPSLEVFRNMSPSPDRLS